VGGQFQRGLALPSVATHEERPRSQAGANSTQDAEPLHLGVGAYLVLSWPAS